jgi:hypothetical protein
MSRIASFIPVDGTIQEQLQFGITGIRAVLYSFVAEKLGDLDRRDEKTLQTAIGALLAAYFEQKEISDALGVSRTTINRWAHGNNIPKSPAYREWMVIQIIELLRRKIPNDSSAPMPAVSAIMAILGENLANAPVPTASGQTSARRGNSSRRPKLVKRS